MVLELTLKHVKALTSLIEQQQQKILALQSGFQAGEYQRGLGRTRARHLTLGACTPGLPWDCRLSPGLPRCHLTRTAICRVFWLQRPVLGVFPTAWADTGALGTCTEGVSPCAPGSLLSRVAGTVLEFALSLASFWSNPDRVWCDSGSSH